MQLRTFCLSLVLALILPVSPVGYADASYPEHLTEAFQRVRESIPTPTPKPAPSRLEQAAKDAFDRIDPAIIDKWTGAFDSTEYKAGITVTELLFRYMYRISALGVPLSFESPVYDDVDASVTYDGWSADFTVPDDLVISARWESPLDDPYAAARLAAFMYAFKEDVSFIDQHFFDDERGFVRSFEPELTEICDPASHNAFKFFLSNYKLSALTDDGFVLVVELS